MIGMIAFLAASASGEIAHGPLAPAEAGKIQCHSPDMAKRTCRSLAYYSLDDSGNYINTAVVLVSADRQLTLETSTPVKVIGEAVCGEVRAEDLLRGRVMDHGKPLGDEQSAVILERVASSMFGLFGHQICTNYKPAGDFLIAKYSIDGIFRPEISQMVIWVAPSAGFSVAP